MDKQLAKEEEHKTEKAHVVVDAETEKEQKQLEAKKELEEQEKQKLIAEMGKIQKSQQTPVTNTDNAEATPSQVLKSEKDNEVSEYEAKVREENKKKREIAPNTINLSAPATGNPLIRARGFVKNGQTDEPIGNVSINIRRLNSIVSQEVTSDARGMYDIVVDSGYFYLVSYYKDKYEISKQILDLTSYKKSEYNMVIQYLKERDDFDPNAKMPVIQFAKNSSKLPADVWGELETIVKMMKDIPDLKIMLYGLASIDEDYPMELSITRARLVADLVLESGIKPARMRINGIGPYRPRSGCTEGKQCTDQEYKLDRVVMYKVIKQ
jgi:outer membrane protein OmpA-like peptidoglycan-associated protein